MKRSFLSLLFLTILSAGRIQGQPCDCKWPIDVIILHTGSTSGNAENISRLAFLADSLKKSCKYLFLVSEMEHNASDSGNSIPYTILRAGKGNRIALLGVLQLRRNGMPGSHLERMKVMGHSNTDEATVSLEKLKKRHYLLAVTQSGLDGDKRLTEMMSRFDLIIGDRYRDKTDSGIVGKTFVRFDRGKIIFIKEETIPANISPR